MIAKLEIASAQPNALAFSSTAVRKLISLDAQTNAEILLEAFSIQQTPAYSDRVM